MNTQFIKVFGDNETQIKSRKDIVVSKLVAFINEETDETTYHWIDYSNPTDEMLFDDGWSLYEKEEDNIEKHIANAKERCRFDIELYDSSSEVNIFYIGEMPMWLDKATRAGLKLRFEAEIAMGHKETTLWYGNTQFPLPLDTATQMLYAIEIYASACYDNTQRHLSVIEKLETIEEIESYNYRDGYPEKLRF